MSKVLTVFGATGNQGGSVIKHILAHPKLSSIYTIRAITRDASKPAAQYLKTRGCEIFEADLDDPKSVRKAIRGSSAVFGVTDFWAKLSYDDEVTQGKSIADSAKDAGVDHLIWSSLVYVSKATDGVITSVKHFDSKAVVEEYIRSLNIPASFYMPGMFLSSLYSMFRPGPDGVYALNLPFPTTTKIPTIASDVDSGAFIAAMLLEGPTGERVAASTELEFAEAAKQYEAGTGRKAVANELSAELFASYLPESVREELSGNMKLIRPDVGGYYVGEPVDAIAKGNQLLEKHGLGPLISFEQYAKNTAAKEAQ
ncbi:NmrA family transcriptional regulator [Pseudovirgaria hyperparasitica]|uniref:NmrA family transcriptional regulator n=1 Tax=Pseudovirgaria hyperparasitica TaxID=470096 RepID=A0A6A6W044_9PEZI|nr:NmrA family transcriptional regulator [Pseudovirgaria hyperparasitica]KAF2754431.1 NmrA family transcriptional regulator [Pseudovirgaria hyperparasitica]